MTICEIVHFSPDPFVERRIPIGAVIGEGTNRRVILAPKHPEWQCAGGWRSALIAAEAMEALSAWDPASDEWPVGFEEILVRSNAYRLPDGLSENDLKARLFGEAQPPDRTSAPRARAATLAKQFLMKRGVARLVSENLDPKTFAKGRYQAATSAGVMKHFVNLDERLLILEPMRVDEKQGQIELTARRLSVWKWAAAKYEWRDVKVVAYALPSDRPDELADSHSVDQVRDFADAVYDVRLPHQEALLIQAIKAAAP